MSPEMSRMISLGLVWDDKSGKVKDSPVKSRISPRKSHTVQESPGESGISPGKSVKVG